VVRWQWLLRFDVEVWENKEYLSALSEQRVMKQREDLLCGLWGVAMSWGEKVKQLSLSQKNQKTNTLPSGDKF